MLACANQMYLKHYIGAVQSSSPLSLQLACALLRIIFQPSFVAALPYSGPTTKHCNVACVLKTVQSSCKRCTAGGMAAGLLHS